MKYSVYIAQILLLLLAGPVLSGCASSRAYEEHVFRFNFDGRTYEIVSMSQAERAGYNLLRLYGEDGELLLEARDDNSDGVLDELLAGDIPLEQANRIYSIGIDEALQRGSLEARDELRIFELEREDGFYVVETVNYEEFTSRRRMVYGYVAPIHLYNEFTVVRPDGQRLVFRDVEADGELGTMDARTAPAEYQRLYREVLNTGMEEERVRIIRDRYIVLFPSRSPRPDL